MKKQLLLVFSALVVSFSYAQDYKITFSYDNAGNQIQRNRVCLTCKSSETKETVTDSTAVIAETPKEDIEDNLLEEGSRITAYPNPVTDILQVEWTPTEKKVDQIMLFSFDNKQIFHKQVNHRLTSLDLDFSRYPSGTYIVLVLYNNNTKQSFKVIKR
ncbi:T9SS type A sorting domain-containing protein [Flavivirga rizhaonensis]|uniref:T9SS type A sorting domain-containing protein n=1 Tax=Flavivirga rizhaonensis TaxID=2559571 RepID=A0A4V3P4N5_9FLAO|nr:T9SS type A sorting domain-containing protein [Flavivirga rizhaonensis]TGV02134.1 T9SS type A sorting domain-containing protein [Flavivirga rizhaonensis]